MNRLHHTPALATVAAALAAPAALAQSPTIHPGFPIVLDGNAVSSVALVQLDEDAEPEIVQAVGSNGLGTSVVAINGNGSTVPGWPGVTFTGTFAAPAFGDIDGDGEGEIVLVSFFFGIGGQLWAFDGDGSVQPGFPIAFGGTLKNPALGDLDLDGDLEILVSFNNGGVADLYAIRGDGTTLPGWPVTLDSTAGASPVVGDVDGDGVNEVFFPTYEQLHGFGPSGLPLLGFPVDLGDQAVSYGTPSLADIDGDGDREIVLATQNENFVDQPGGVWVLQHDGTNLPGWPVQTSSSVYTPPSVADLDGDGSPEVIVGDQLLSPIPVNSMYAWRADGTPQPGFPVSGLDAFHQQITVADVDGDGEVELLHETNVAGQSYFARNADGSAVSGWTLPTGPNTQSFNQQLSVGDVDGDGLLEIVGTVERFQSGQSELYVWDTTAVWDPDLAPVPTHMYGADRAGHVNAELAPLTALYGCGQNPPGSLARLAGQPTPGGVVTLGVDNPLGTQPAGSIAVLAYGAVGIGNPCGPVIPGLGMAGGGAGGELLLAPGYLLFGAQPFGGAGVPAGFDVPIPADPNLIGVELFWQGAIADGVLVGLSTGLRMRVGI